MSLQDKQNRQEREWLNAIAYVDRAFPTSWPQALREARAMDEDQLKAAPQSEAVRQVRQARGL